MIVFFFLKVRSNLLTTKLNKDFYLLIKLIYCSVLTTTYLNYLFFGMLTFRLVDKSGSEGLSIEAASSGVKSHSTMCTLGQTKFSCCRTCGGDGELALLTTAIYHFLVNRLNFLSCLKKKYFVLFCQFG